MFNNLWDRLIWCCAKFRNVYLFIGLLLIGCILGIISLVDFSMLSDSFTDVLSLLLDVPKTESYIKGRISSFLTAIIFLILGFSQILLSLENILHSKLYKALFPLIFGAFLVIIGRAFFALCVSFLSVRLIIIVLLLVTLLYLSRKNK